MSIAASLPDELNTFYARFEADNTAHIESAPAAAAEEVSALSRSVANVTRPFKRENNRKAVGPDGIPARVLRACAFQLAGVFTDIFSLSPLWLWFPHASKIHQCAHSEEKYNYSLPINVLSLAGFASLSLSLTLCCTHKHTHTHICIQTHTPTLSPPVCHHNQHSRCFAVTPVLTLI